MSNGLDPDQDRRYVGPDLGPNCLSQFLGLFKYECNQLHNFLHIYATSKCYTFLEKNYLSPLNLHQL